MARIFKFGGALIKDAEGIRQVVSIIRSYADKPFIVVISAIGKTTNALENILQMNLDKQEDKLHDALLSLKQQHTRIAEKLGIDNLCENELDTLFDELEKELDNKPADRYAAYDRIVSFGERFASLILFHFFMNENLTCERIDARKIITTDNNYTAAKINWTRTADLVKKVTTSLFAAGKFMLTEGFIGADGQGNPTTLGREGSDFSAAILAYVLDAREVTIWKDVPGLMNADPNRFDDSIKLDQISYHEAIELAFYGASVIHPKTIQPLQKKNIPLLIKSFYQPENNPSVISDDTSMDDKIPKIIIKDNQVLLSIQSKDLSFIAEDNLTAIFKAFSRQKIHINLMQHSAVSFSVCFNHHPNKLDALLNDLRSDFPYKYNTGLQLITIRHYTEEIIENLLEGKEVFVEQKSRSVFQMLVK